MNYFAKQNGYRILQDTMMLLEYFYKKGVSDAIINLDDGGVRSIIEREIDYKTFQMLFDMHGVKMDLNTYIGYILSESNNVKCNYFMAYFIHTPKDYMIKNAMCYLCDEYYRQGLEDAMQLDINNARKFINLKPGNHTTIKGKKTSNDGFISNILRKISEMFLLAQINGNEKECNELRALCDMFAISSRNYKDMRNDNNKS